MIDENQAEVGKATAGWASNLNAAEFRTLTPNRTLMETLARGTGGEMVAPDRLAAFVKELPNRRMPVTETWTTPLWHTPILFILALACFVAEWGLRRWSGLA